MIQLFRPTVDVEAVLARLKPVLESGWLGQGALVEEFEQAMAKRAGAKHFIATSSGTASLHLALHVLDLPRGSNVLTTPVTFVSTNAALLYTGLKPVFCDVEPRTGNIDASLVDDAVKRYRCRALVVVHLGGYRCDMATINEVAHRRRVPVVEDCAHCDATASSNLCCWSFHPVKPIAMGDGGGVSVNDDKVAARLRRLRWMGISKDTHTRSKGGYKWDYDICELGWKYHLNDVQVVLGMTSLRLADWCRSGRQGIAEQYWRGLNFSGHPNYHPCDSMCHFYPWFFRNRDRVARALARAGIETGMHYKLNTRYAPFKGFLTVNGLKGARWYEAHELTLPLHSTLTDADVAYIIEQVNKCSR